MPETTNNKTVDNLIDAMIAANLPLYELIKNELIKIRVASEIFEKLAAIVSENPDISGKALIKKWAEQQLSELEAM